MDGEIATRGDSGDSGALVLTGCPDARPPAYEAAAGLSSRGRLGCFATAFYDRPRGFLSRSARVFGGLTGRRGDWERRLGRRRHGGIPAELVVSRAGVDAAMALENRLSGGARRWVGRWRTRSFDRALRGVAARELGRGRLGAGLIFSDVGSEFTLPALRSWGVPAVLSMVHGDVREERALLEEEAERAPEYFPLYLGDGALDRAELDWLHERRLRDLELADRILVPSEHIAGELRRHGTPGERVEVIPYGADAGRFVPRWASGVGDSEVSGGGCTFLFAGGICQRKGIKYLLEAWSLIRRRGWRLALLGGAPRNLGPIGRHLEARDSGIELWGRVGHAEMGAKLASADVFVFPSLFEGSAVVTYEAMACGLPIVTTPNAGSVARDGVEGRLVGIRDVEGLAARMEELGSDAELRRAMGRAARARAEEFSWVRYSDSVVRAIDRAIGGSGSGSLGAEDGALVGAGSVSGSSGV